MERIGELLQGNGSGSVSAAWRPVLQIHGYMAHYLSNLKIRKVLAQYEQPLTTTQQQLHAISIE
jgi:hypothetical protein